MKYILLYLSSLLTIQASAEPPAFNALPKNDPLYPAYQVNLCRETRHAANRFDLEQTRLDKAAPPSDPIQRITWAENYLLTVDLKETLFKQYDENCRHV